MHLSGIHEAMRFARFEIGGGGGKVGGKQERQERACLTRRICSSIVACNPHLAPGHTEERAAVTVVLRQGGLSDVNPFPLVEGSG